MNNTIKQKIFYNNMTSGFFSWKRIFLFSLSTSIFIVAIALVFWGMNINLSDMWNLLVESSKKSKIIFLYIFIILMYPFSRSIYIFSYIRPKLMSEGVYISWTEYFALFAKIVIINCITPFASGSEPYSIYWMTSRGANIKTANSISVINGFIAGISELIITIPSFIVLSINYHMIANNTFGIVVYWFILGGITVNSLILMAFVVLGFSKKTHYIISVFWNFILMKIERPYLQKRQIYNKYIINSEFKIEFKKSLKNKKFILYIVLSYALWSFFYYNTIYLSFLVLNIDDSNISSITNYLMFFNISNVSITANNFIPIPGGEGTIQITVAALIDTLTNINLSSHSINNSIAFWRISTNYFPLVWCLMFVGVYYSIKISLINKFKSDKKFKI